MPPNPDCLEFYTGAPVDSADLLFRKDFPPVPIKTFAAAH